MMLLNAIILLAYLSCVFVVAPKVTPVSATQYPFIAEISATKLLRGPTCAGTILRLEYPFTILTASSCLDWFDKETPSYLFLGRTDHSPGETDIANTPTANNNFTIHQNQIKTVAYPNASSNFGTRIALIFYDMDLSEDPRLSVAELGTINNATTECCEDDDPVEQIGYYWSYEWNYDFTILGVSNFSYINRERCIKKRAALICPDCSPIDLPDTTMCATLDDQWATRRPCISQNGAPVIATGTNTLLGLNGYTAGFCPELNPNGYAIPSVFLSAAAMRDWIEDEIDLAVNTLTSNPTIEPTTIPTLEPTTEPTGFPTMEPTEKKDEPKDNDPDLDSIGFIFLWIFCAILALLCIALLAVTCDRYDKQRRLGHSSLPTVHDDDDDHL